MSNERDKTPIRVALKRLGFVQRGEQTTATLDREDCVALLVHIQELRRDVGMWKQRLKRLASKRGGPSLAARMREIADALDVK